MKNVLLTMVCLIATAIFGGGNLKAQEATNNVSFAESDDNQTLTVTVNGTTTDADAQLFETQLNGKSYSKVIFNGGGTVNDSFVTKLNNKTSIEVLDLDGVFVDNLTSATIPTGLNSNWKELTFPMTKTVDNEMVLPTAMLSNYQWTSDLSLKVVIPEGYTKIADKAFQNNKKVTSLSLPTTLKTIGKFAFASTGLTELSLPEGLDKVDDGAFYELKALAVVKLNENLRYIGAGAFGCSGNIDEPSVQRTITIPGTVRFIGPYAFAERKFSDIYFQGKNAPVCPYGSFVYDTGWNETKTMWGTAFTGTDDKVHYCNGGYAAKGNELSDNVSDGYANRENYKNGYYMTIMHYPTDANYPDKYSDQTRKYETKFTTNSDGSESFAGSTTHMEVGKESVQLQYFFDSNSSASDYNKGNAQVANNFTGTEVEVGYRDTYVGGDYIWPSQSQFIRAYVTAGLGLKWDGVTPVDTKLSPEDEEVLKEAGYDLTDETLSYNAFLGTRKFALTNADVKSSPNYEIKMEGGKWWTLCVPFNMTKKQVVETFGDKTQVCLFTSVTRTIVNSGTNSIVLRFVTDVMQHNCTDADGKMKDEYGKWNYGDINEAVAPNDNDIVIYAHESYMIKPSITDNDAVFVVNNYDPIQGNPLPTVVSSKDEILQAESGVDYRFIGNYIGSSTTTSSVAPQVSNVVYIPQYSYVYFRPNGYKDYMFWFYTSANTAVWKPNKSIVQAISENHDGGKLDWDNFFNAAKIDTPSTNNAKQISLFGEENNNDVTSIGTVEIIAGEASNSPIYSLDGQLVSSDGNLSSLAKGIYIQNGKKYIVK